MPDAWPNRLQFVLIQWRYVRQCLLPLQRRKEDYLEKKPNQDSLQKLISCFPLFSSCYINHYPVQKLLSLSRLN